MDLSHWCWVAAQIAVPRQGVAAVCSADVQSCIGQGADSSIEKEGVEFVGMRLGDWAKTGHCANHQPRQRQNMGVAAVGRGNVNFRHNQHGAGERDIPHSGFGDRSSPGGTEHGGAYPVGKMRGAVDAALQ